MFCTYMFRKVCGRKQIAVNICKCNVPYLLLYIKLHTRLNLRGITCPTSASDDAGKALRFKKQLRSKVRCCGGLCDKRTHAQCLVQLAFLGG